MRRSLRSSPQKATKRCVASNSKSCWIWPFIQPSSPPGARWFTAKRLCSVSQRRRSWFISGRNYRPLITESLWHQTEELPLPAITRWKTFITSERLSMSVTQTSRSMLTLMTPRSLPDTSSRYWTHSDSLQTRTCQSNPLWRYIDITFKTHL